MKALSGTGVGNEALLLELPVEPLLPLPPTAWGVELVPETLRALAPAFDVLDSGEVVAVLKLEAVVDGLAESAEVLAAVAVTALVLEGDSWLLPALALLPAPAPDEDPAVAEGVELELVELNAD